MNSELLRVSDAPNFSSRWVGIAMLSRRTCCARAPLALLALLSRLPLITLLSLSAGLALVTLLALLPGLPLRTRLSRGSLHRGWAFDATAHKYG
jgi:hypothetical protein